MTSVKYQVFISSTCNDLKEERNSASQPFFLIDYVQPPPPRTNSNFKWTVRIRNKGASVYAVTVASDVHELSGQIEKNAAAYFESEAETWIYFEMADQRCMPSSFLFSIFYVTLRGVGNVQRYYVDDWRVHSKALDERLGASEEHLLLSVLKPVTKPT